MNEETRQFIRTHRTPDTDIRRLAMQAARYPQVNMPLAAEQIAGWQTALRKLPAWAATEGLLFPPRISMEQCSSEPAARYKAALCERILKAAGIDRSTARMADLTGGFGVDFSYMAQAFGKADYVEQQEILCQRAQHNFPLLGLSEKARIHHCTTEEYLSDLAAPIHLFYLDPARRDRQGGRVTALEDCTPDITLLLPELLRKARYTLLKLSPMLDLAALARQLPGTICEAHIVAVEGECKELLLLLSDPAAQPAIPAAEDAAAPRPDKDFPLTAVEIYPGRPTLSLRFRRSSEQMAACPHALPPADTPAYLYEPGSALLKAGALRLCAERYGLTKLSRESHLYHSVECRKDFPGRCFRLEQIAGFGKQNLKQLLQGATKANLTVRGFPQSVDQLRRRLKLKEGGEIYLFAATAPDGKHILLRCRKPES